MNRRFLTIPALLLAFALCFSMPVRAEENAPAAPETEESAAPETEEPALPQGEENIPEEEPDGKAQLNGAGSEDPEGTTDDTVPEENEGDGEPDGEPYDEPDAVAVEIHNQSETVEGNVSIADRDRNVTGILVTEDEGKAIEVTVNGDVTAEDRTDHYNHQGCTAVDVSAAGEGSEAAITVNGDVTATNVWTAGEDMNLDNAGISAWVGEGGKATVTVNGDVYAGARLEGDTPEDGYTWSAGAGAYNDGGEVTVIINGDVTAESTKYAVGLNVKNDMPGDGNTLVQVNGDLKADTLAIRAENSSDTRMEIIVNGTVETSKDGISLEGDGNEEVQLTFWKAETSQQGTIIRVDDENPAEKAARMEAAIQYIIRIEDKSSQYISTDARQYREFQVANEGETVTLKITVPKGYEIGKVFGQQGEQMELTKDADGNYFLRVPKGGGIELSLSLNALPKKQGQAGPSLKPAEDTPQTRKLKEGLKAGDSAAADIPEDILSRLPRESLTVSEMVTLKLNYPNADKAVKDASFTIRTGRVFAEGDRVTVVIVLPREDGSDWFVLEGTGTADGKLRITLSPEMIRRLAGRIFAALIL